MSDTLASVQYLLPHINDSLSSGYHHRKLAWYIKSELNLLKTHAGVYAPLNHSGVIQIIGFLTQGIDDSQARLIQKVRSDRSLNAPQDTRKILSWIELATRIWLNVNVDSSGIAPASCRMSPSPRITWRDSDKSLRTLLQDQFSTSPGNGDLNCEIPPSLTMQGLFTRAKVRIYWTDNLLDHLSLTQQNGEHAIVFYQHLVCLLNHREYSDQCAIPSYITEEAIRTFVLLFPTGLSEKDATKRFLRKHKGDFFKVGFDELHEERVLDLRQYPHWGGRIKMMITIMENPTRGWRQAVLDREGRNFEQVVSIWVGTIATILAVVALVFGIISTVLAFKANRIAAEANGLAQQSLALGREANEIARQSFKLDLRQACLGANATDDLAEFCA